MKKYSKLIVAAIVALIFIGTFVFLYEKSQPKPVEYTEFTPKMADVLKTTVITGKIEPRNEVSVKPQISGIITEICKEAGDYVQAGEVIAKVKVIPDMGQLSSAQARVRLAEINLKQAQVNYGREEQLYKKQLVSADEFDKVKQSLQQAKEEKVAALDALEVVRDGVSKSNASASSTLIRSTISGIILDIPVKVGNSVILANTFNDGTTIASVANMNDLIFRGNIDETEVGSLVTGMPYLNFLCIVLWCQTFIPIHAPMLPPSTASNKSVASEMRHLAFFALYLSMPYMMNATALMARR